MNWSNEVTLEFLKLYEREPAIWNPKDEQHKNRNVVNEAWQRIQRSLSEECSVKDLKRKKESLMAIFRTLVNKLNTSRKSNCGTDDVYTPSWFAFETMAKFLHGIYQPRIAINTENLVIAADDTEQNIEETNEEYDETQIAITEEEDEENTATKIFLNNVTASNTFTFPPDRSSRKTTRSPTENIESRTEDSYKIFKTGCDNCDMSDKDRDEFSQYANLLTTKLKKFDERSRVILMHEIDNVIFKAKMQQLIHQHSQPLPSTSSFDENYCHQRSYGLDSYSTPNRSYHYAQSSQRHYPYSQSSPKYSSPSPNLPHHGRK